MKKITALLVVVGLAFLAYSNQTPSSQNKIRIGLNAWPGYEFLYLAKEKGFYAEEGLDIDIVEYISLEDIRFGYERGQVEIMASTLTELLLSAERTDKEPQLFFLADFSNGADVVVTRSNIQDISMLAGKVIAVEPDSLGLFMLARTLKEAGLELEDVDVVGMSQSKMYESMVDNSIDAAVSYPPTSVNILRDISDTHTIFDTSRIPGEVIDIVSADKAFIKQNPDALKAVIRAWDKAVNFSIQNPEEAFSIMSKREQISPEEFKDVLSGIRVLKSEAQLPLFDGENRIKASIELVNQVMIQNNFLSKEFDANDLYTTSILETAYEE